MKFWIAKNLKQAVTNEFSAFVQLEFLASFLELRNLIKKCDKSSPIYRFLQIARRLLYSLLNKI